jgi:hypothetical protein
MRAVDNPILLSSLSRYTRVSKAPTISTRTRSTMQQNPPQQLVTSRLPWRVKEAGYSKVSSQLYMGYLGRPWMAFSLSSSLGPFCSSINFGVILNLSKSAVSPMVLIFSILGSGIKVSLRI